MDLRMETSQAVSMLQPFRHPKPGLTIMDKAEEFLTKKFIDTNLRVESNIPGISEDYFYLVDLLDKYAQQISRKVAQEYEHFLYESKEIQTHPESQGKGWGAYQDWKSKQK